VGEFEVAIGEVALEALARIALQRKIDVNRD
jgi:hypothetical protein